MKIVDEDIRKSCSSKGFSEEAGRATRMVVSRPMILGSMRLGAFGRVLALIKFLDLVNFEEVFYQTYMPKLPSLEKSILLI